MGQLSSVLYASGSYETNCAYFCALEECPHDRSRLYKTEERNVPEEVRLYGTGMHGVADDVVGLEPPRELFRHQYVGQLRGAVDSFCIIVPARSRNRIKVAFLSKRKTSCRLTQ